VPKLAFSLEGLAFAIYFIFPAYAANAAPILFGGGPPIDRGRSFIDGRPILGPNKTFRGLVSGLILGSCVGLAEYGFFNGLLVAYGFFSEPLIPHSSSLGLLLSAGALVGDMTGSFLKRRLGMEPGRALPIVDQISFAVLAMAFAAITYPVSFELFISVMLVTIPIHLATNMVAFLSGLKKNPW